MVEHWEETHLSPRAAKSRLSKGRIHPEPECDVRTVYQRDRDRIIHSKAFRRLDHKTQVFIAPQGDHYRTRLTHTLEVSQIARTVARSLCLNEDLTEAIALGHDLGHTPFGHTGEDVLNKLLAGGFRHNQQSLRVVDKLEQGKGLNLTYEVRDGILNHSGPGQPSTLEGQIVKIADRMAYINHDIDDALRGGVITPDDLPGEEIRALGTTISQRINAMVRDMIESSWDSDHICLSKHMQQILDNLREFMFSRVYIGSEAKKEEEKARHVVETLYRYFLANPEMVPEEFLRGEELSRGVADYIAGMTDRFIIKLYNKLFIPDPWQ